MSESVATILVVDDDPATLALLAGILERKGFRVQPADSGKLALSSIAAHAPDLLLLDVRMPDMDGFEVCRRLRATEAGRLVPVMFVSASRDADEWVEGLSLGAVDFISKPFHPEELIARVRTHVELNRLRTNLELLVSQRTAALQAANDLMRLEIEERQRAEEALRESERRFRHIANAAPVMIWTSDANHHIDFWNEHTVKFSGIPMGQLMSEQGAHLIHPEDREKHLGEIQRAMQNRERFEAEYRVRRSDGEYRHVLNLGTPRLLDHGEFAGYVGIVFDLTDIRKSQERAMRAQSLENLRVFSAGIAHDFNTLIGVIFGEVDLALGEMPEDSPGRDNIERINSIAKRAAEIVRLLMAYVGDPYDPAVLDLVDLSSVVREIVPYLKGSFVKRAEIQIDIAEKLPSIRANMTQMRLMVLHLIMNAIESLSGEPGRVTVSAGVREMGAGLTEADGNGLPKGRCVKLEISDTGHGMTEEIHGRIFDPYYTTKLPGRGLGLAAVQGIVRSHGGAILSQTTEGRGTTFQVLLPLP